jgi:hypothetical protein
MQDTREVGSQRDKGGGLRGVVGGGAATRMAPVTAVATHCHQGALSAKASWAPVQPRRPGAEAGGRAPSLQN